MENKKFIIGSVIGIILLIIIGTIFLIKGCALKQYTITFDSNGGSSVSEQIVKENHKVTKPVDPVKDGYTFMGWYYEDKAYDFNTLVKHDMTLEARWEKIGTEKVSGVELNLKELSLALNETAKLEVNVLPANALNKKVIWTSSDESIATVDENGVITALKEGKVIITVTTEDGHFTATCEVTVTNNVVPVTKIYIVGSTTVSVGDTIKLSAVIEPSNASNKGVSWMSSDITIASVDIYGNVFGKRKGEVIITAKTSDGRLMASVKVQVVDKPVSENEPKPTDPDDTEPEENPSTPSEPTNPSTPSGSEEDPDPNTPTKPEENPNPENPENPDTPDNPDNPDTPENPDNPNPGTSTEPEEIEVTNVRINSENLTLKIGERKTLTATIEPVDATNKSITWSSEDESVVKVNENGEIEALKPGKTRITVTASNGKSASIEVEVKDKEYIVVLTGLQHETVPIYQYEITKLTSDGEEISFKELQFDEGTHIVKLGQTIPEGWLKRESVKTVDIILTNDEKITATIEYQVRLVD